MPFGSLAPVVPGGQRAGSRYAVKRRSKAAPAAVAGTLSSAVTPPTDAVEA
jgi:hypothetical protein